MVSRLNSPLANLAVILGGLLALRVALLFILPWGLHGDEAQYWAWSQDPAFGYFSKPPMIAWVIGFTTGIFGNAEWAVRLAAPVLHIVTSVMIFLAGRRLFSAEVGFWAALIYSLMPAVWLSSYIMSTDASLLLCWAVALHAWACLRGGGGWGRALQLGLALGLGLMSKYAMAFMVPILGLAVLFDPPSRKALLNVKGLLVAALAIAILTPNLMWNAAHEFATISHTAENTNLGRDLFNPSEVLKFWVDQFGVFGFLPFPMLGLALLAAARGALEPPVKWIAAFAALPLIVITLQALLSRANANWAVTAYVAAPILLAVWALGTPRRLTWLKWGLAGQTALILILGGVASSPRSVDAAGIHNAVKRLRAWPETAEAVRQRAVQDEYAFITVDNRLIFYDLNYYPIFPDSRSIKRSRELPKLTMWSLNNTPAHHANLTRALPATDQPVLILSYHHNFEDYLREDFESLTPLEPIIIDLGPGKTRHLKAWRGTGYKPTSREDRH
jgi:4-amino-4-deoxy-L-arabinose transferase-like glycosyltransferase